MFSTLLQHPQLHKHVMGNLTFSAQMKAVLTAEFQFLDLYQDNLGVIPLLDQQSEIFRTAKFSYGLTVGVPFVVFLQRFLSGRISEKTSVYVSSPDKTVKSKQFEPLAKIPGLLEALQGQWEFVLFDTDRVLSESNDIHMQNREGKPESLIPLRSVLLASPWKDIALSAGIVDKLLKTDRDQRVRHWVNRHDAPIRKWMKHPEQIDALLAKVIEQDKYTLSFHRRMEHQITVEELRKMFSEELSDLEQHRDIWMAIQHQLSDDPLKGWFKPYLVQEGDTLSEIAENHRLTVEELKALNPKIQEPLKQGVKLKVKPDLTDKSLVAKKMRKNITPQFFPHLSWKQRDALFQRQDRRTEYLQNWRRLQKMGNFNQLALEELHNILASPSTPLTSKLKNEFLQQLAIIQESSRLNKDISQEFHDLLNELQVQLIPTYFNVVKAMYPLVADSFDLLLRLYNQNQETAGMSIGLYSRPLETLFEESRDKEADDPYLLRGAEELHKRLSKIKERPTAFYGEWSSDSEKLDRNLKGNQLHLSS